IYYSGHGKLDRAGRLCLATADTRQGALLATSISARHLRDLVEESDCDQVVLLLDCCYSGAVEGALKGDVDSELHIVENARGFYIMTASSNLQAARETEVVSGGAVMGRFTAALVNGIESGAADAGRKGKILLSDLRRHLGKVVTGQTPQFFDLKASGDPLISHSPATALPLLNAGVLADLDAEQWHRRRGAVSALGDVLRDGDAAVRAAATAALQRRLGQERDFAVRAALESALGVQSVGAPGMPPPSPPHQTASASSSSLGWAETADEAATRGVSLYEAGRHADAARAFQVAAFQGHVDALFNLGVLYNAGQGVPQSHAEAARLFKFAAELGHADAQFNLGLLYEVGRGVPQSTATAVDWYRKAARQGNTQAQAALRILRLTS
ncbi:MAG TPA: hypothetical protein VJ779_07355, partial [Acetobacteraceae bacterium]|nr:hypothetical protein [Acetobacteraceae bacterium]